MKEVVGCLVETIMKHILSPSPLKYLRNISLFPSIWKGMKPSSCARDALHKGKRRGDGCGRSGALHGDGDSRGHHTRVLCTGLGASRAGSSIARTGEDMRWLAQAGVFGCQGGPLLPAIIT